MRVGVCGAWVVLIAVGIARADIDPVSGIDFVTVGALGNRAYDGPDPQGLVAGRGSVGYTYGIGRFEITTAQWMEYVNAYSARSDAVNIGELGFPVHWGATVDGTYYGPGTRFRLRAVDNAAMLPVGGLSWRQAAMYVNWLNHDKDPALASRLTGAYDASTFGFSASGFTDQREHTPGARYWIPTLDEWLKAVHYDPDATGPNGEQGRWWQQPNSSDITLTYGPPPSFGGNGTGQANSGFFLTNGVHWNIPLGAYPNVTSPWGLLDAAGGTAEWCESIFVAGSALYRIQEGSYSGSTSALAGDLSFSFGAELPSSASPWQGFRIASSIPAPSSLTVVFGCAFFLQCRKRRVDTNATSEVLFCSSGARVRRAREGPDR